MKTREQLIEEIFPLISPEPFKEDVEKIIDLVVSACEEAVSTMEQLERMGDYWSLGWDVIRKRFLRNLKKLKSK